MRASTNARATLGGDVGTREADPALRAGYVDPDDLSRRLHPSTTATVHALAAREKQMNRTTPEELQ